MSSDFANTVRRKARKDYRCDAFDIINDTGYGEADYTADEWALIEKARKEGGSIMKGTEYLHTTGKHWGDLFTARSRPELADICFKYGFYDD